jgi:hypothetical protein
MPIKIERNFQMSNFWQKQPSSRVVRAQELDWTGSGTLVTTNLSAGVNQVRVVSDVRGYVSFSSTSISSSSRGTSFAEIMPNVAGEYFTCAQNSVIAWSSSSTSSGSVLISEVN